MDELICRAVKGRVSEEEAAELFTWRRQSLKNEAYYRDLVRLLREFEVTESRARVSPPPPVEALIPELASGGGALARWRVRRVVLRRGVGGALAAALALAVVVLLGGRGFDRPPEPLTMGTGEIVTGPAETTTVTLGDGTIVRLAPESRLRIPSSPGTREVWLEGHAYFAVAKQQGRPFRVRTHAGDAVVLGTRFDLRVREDDLRVLVVDGAVEVSAQGARVDAQARQMVRVRGSQPPVREDVDPRYLEQEIGWLGDFLVFEDTPLAQAADELSAHYRVPVVVLDTTLARSTVRGMFLGEDLEDVVGVLCRAVSAQCHVAPSGVSIGP